MELNKAHSILIIRYLFISVVVVALLFSSFKTHAQAAKVKPMMVEVIAKAGATVDRKTFGEAFSKSAIPAPETFEWHNHLVAYLDMPDTIKLLKVLAAKLPSCQVKLYTHPFYNFNRTYCSNSATAKQWTNIILTADLVADVKMQHEYLNYHATQFQNWPEVSNGFCHANFQQLLVFKNGRQLMLVISIPKGESLDKLNPKTTENNPRVVEWNKLMSKYQEGIPGTKKDETWVFLKNLKDK